MPDKGKSKSGSTKNSKSKTSPKKTNATTQPKGSKKK